MTLKNQATLAKSASLPLGQLSSDIKDSSLLKMADALEENAELIIKANSIDVKNAEDKGRTRALIDRLILNDDRIKSMADGLRVIASLSDPIGEVVSEWKRPNGLQIGEKRVPLGLVAMIYESRPNVTVDAIGLCLKTGNSVILRGSSEAINSNKSIVNIMSEAAYKNGIPKDSIQLIIDTDRKSVESLVKLKGIVDVVVPRGGAGLINTVSQMALVPVIETGIGICHTYIDYDVDLDMARDIIINAKIQRPGVCNAMETLLINKDIAKDILPGLSNILTKNNVELRGCNQTLQIIDNASKASEDDWSTEYLDYILAIKIVSNIEEAIEHINIYGSGHSEAIVTNNYFNAESFLNKVDAAAVYVNASTRFTDGFEFGFGAELGISTQKLHARGPMGLKELTTSKYIIRGEGQIRS